MTRLARRLASPLVPLLLSGLAPAILVAAEPRAPSPPERIELTGPADLPMLRRGPMPAVEVTVDGKGPYLFGIDTGGSGHLRIDERLVEALGLATVGEVLASDGSGRSAGPFPIVAVGEIAIGPLVVRGAEAMSRDYNRGIPPGMPELDGVLGIELFDGMLLTLDYPGSRVRLDRGALPAPDGRSVFCFTRRRLAGPDGAEEEAGPPVLEIRVGETAVETDLDTGSMGGLLLPAELVSGLEKTGEPRVVGRARTVSGEFEISVVPVATPIRLGELPIEVPGVAYAEPLPRANLGSRWLADWALTIDLANRRLRLARGPEAAGGS